MAIILALEEIFGVPEDDQPGSSVYDRSRDQPYEAARSEPRDTGTDHQSSVRKRAPPTRGWEGWFTPWLLVFLVAGWVVGNVIADQTGVDASGLLCFTGAMVGRSIATRRHRHWLLHPIVIVLCFPRLTREARDKIPRQKHGRSQNVLQCFSHHHRASWITGLMVAQVPECPGIRALQDCVHKAWLQ
jgi:hypothetical protein